MGTQYVYLSLLSLCSARFTYAFYVLLLIGHATLLLGLNNLKMRYAAGVSCERSERLVVTHRVCSTAALQIARGRDSRVAAGVSITPSRIQPAIRATLLASCSSRHLCRHASSVGVSL